MGSHCSRFASAARLLAACLFGGAAAGRAEAGITYLSQSRQVSAEASSVFVTPPVQDRDVESEAGTGRWQSLAEFERTYAGATGRNTLAARVTVDSTLSADLVRSAGTLSASNAGDGTGFSAMAHSRTEITFRVDRPQAFDVTSFVDREPGGFPTDRSSSNIEIRRVGGGSVFSLLVLEDQSLDGSGTLDAGEYALTYATSAGAHTRVESADARYGVELRFADGGGGGSGGPVAAVPLPPAAVAALLPLAWVMAGGRWYRRRRHAAV